MVINRQKPPVLVAQRLAASLANHGTGKLLLPILFHVRPPPMVFNTVIAVVKKNVPLCEVFSTTTYTSLSYFGTYFSKAI